MSYNVVRKISPNRTVLSSRNIDRVVLHWMVGTLAGTDAVFANPSNQVSAHWGVENNNRHRYVDDKDIAWHAMSGNPTSIGIEISAAPGRSPSASTYTNVIDLVTDICRQYKLSDSAIHVHNHYVNTRCPGANQAGAILEAGGVDVARIRREVKSKLTSGGGAPPTGGYTVNETDLNAIYTRGPLALGGYQSRSRRSKEGSDVYLGKTAAFVINDHFNSTEAKNKRAAEQKKVTDLTSERNTARTERDTARRELTAEKSKSAGLATNLNQSQQELNAARDEVKRLEKELAERPEGEVSDDTVKLNALGQALQWLIKRLGLKGE